MTIKATFPDGTVLFFGDSYRKWFDQLREYCVSWKQPRPGVVKSTEKWISYGGLKWCDESYLRESLLNERAGRSLDSFTWKPLNQIERRTLEKHVPDSRVNDEVSRGDSATDARPQK
jgi:hypothetical protein